VEPIGIDLEVGQDETIIEAAWRLGFYWPTVCFGQATCTVCHVEVLDGFEHLSALDEEERRALNERLPVARRRDITRLRLACRTRVIGDATVEKKGVRPA
jgi:2Fe-2S ferredoxin